MTHFSAETFASMANNPAFLAAGLVSPISPFHASPGFINMMTGAHMTPQSFQAANTAYTAGLPSKLGPWGAFPFLQQGHSSSAGTLNPNALHSMAAGGADPVTYDPTALYSSPATDTYGVPLSNLDLDFLTPTKGTGSVAAGTPTSLYPTTFYPTHPGLGKANQGGPAPLGPKLGINPSDTTLGKTARRTVSDGEAYWAGLALQMNAQGSGHGNVTPVRPRVVSYHGASDVSGAMPSTSLLLSAVPARKVAVCHSTPRRKRARKPDLTQGPEVLAGQANSAQRFSRLTSAPLSDPVSPTSAATLKRKRKSLGLDLTRIPSPTTAAPRISTASQGNPHWWRNTIPLSTLTAKSSVNQVGPSTVVRSTGPTSGVENVSTGPATDTQTPASKRAKTVHCNEEAVNSPASTTDRALAQIDQSLEKLESQWAGGATTAVGASQSKVSRTAVASMVDDDDEPLVMTRDELDSGAAGDDHSVLRNLKHKVAEQKRRDAMKEAFERLKRIVPPGILETEDGRELARPIILSRAVDYMEQLIQEVSTLRNYHRTTTGLAPHYPVLGLGVGEF
ncbi:hypothetical protein IWQ60_000661 [Tieghemiomyces parasiticus]|uniref:BHLH domain-containing protein n=1 Tax=Tieghemiomyces parasiticus TaxID=78921 RepID=A0A9W8DXD6_9FUNG|nr:hypothetical protein IWQ60_000661 [Tieghemiomyces parasiticus]